jgi:excinuclease UvrABC nuclease subunit
MATEPLSTDSGPGSSEGFAPARSRTLDRLEAERRQAEGCFEHERAAELAAQIARLSAAGSSQNPARETTSRRKK